MKRINLFSKLILLDCIVLVSLVFISLKGFVMGYGFYFLNAVDYYIDSAILVSLGLLFLVLDTIYIGILADCDDDYMYLLNTYNRRRRKRISRKTEETIIWISWIMLIFSLGIIITKDYTKITTGRFSYIPILLLAIVHILGIKKQTD